MSVPNRSQTSPFSRTALFLLIACAIALFALSVLLRAYGGDRAQGGDRVRPGSYSASAIGYGGFYDVLRRLDRPVTRGLENTLALVGSRGTLVVAEPDLGRMTNDEGLKLIHAPRLLLVLPKWRGTPDDLRPSWISGVEPVPLLAARQTLALVAGNRADVLRTEWPASWPANDLGIRPEGSGIVQLIRSSAMRTVVGGEDGALVAEITDGKQRVWVLSDPDVMSNHGIGKGENAAFMIALVDTLRSWNNTDMEAPIVFDETVHGFHASQRKGESPLRLLFRFPYSIVALLLCGAALLFLAAGTGRFGAPLHPRPPFDFGKARLIDNGARLFDYAGHHAVVLDRYVRMTIRSAAQALHIPPGLEEPAVVAALDRIGKARGVTRSCSDILATVSEVRQKQADDAAGRENKQALTRLFESAWDIYCWKGELLHDDGFTTDRHDRRNNQG